MAEPLHPDPVADFGTLMLTRAAASGYAVTAWERTGGGLCILYAGDLPDGLVYLKQAFDIHAANLAKPPTNE